MFWNKLPHCDKLFRNYLSPWYPKGERPRMTRPDMFVIRAFEGQTLDMAKTQYLPPKELAETIETFATMRKSYQQDFQHFLQFEALHIGVIDAIDQRIGKEEVKALIKASSPRNFGNNYLVFVCELGLALGDLFVETGKFKWLYSFPYFHSIVVHPESGTAITVFDWAVKKLSAYGLTDGLKNKFDSVILQMEDPKQWLGADLS